MDSLPNAARGLFSKLQQANAVRLSARGARLLDLLRRILLARIVYRRRAAGVCLVI